MFVRRLSWLLPSCIQRSVISVLFVFLVAFIGFFQATPAQATLSAPTNLQVTGTTTSSVTVSWNAVTGASYYYVAYKKSTDSSYTIVNAGSGTAKQLTGLIQSTTYLIHVYAQDGAYNRSPDTADISATTLTLAAPSGLTATAVSQGQISLSWTASTYATSYYVYRKTGNYGTYAQIGTASSTTYTDSSVALTDMKDSYYQVRAYDGINLSGGSKEATASVITFSNVVADIPVLPVLRTNYSDTVGVKFSIDSAATVTLKIIPEKQGPTGTPVYQASQAVPMGWGSLLWDGKDSTGKVVPDDAYLYVLEAVKGTSKGWYSPAAPSTTGTVSCSQTGAYDAFRNQPLVISYSPSQPARVNLSINFPSKYSSLYVSILSGFPVVAGSNSITWDGRDTSGKIMFSGGAVNCSIASAMRENYIITSGDKPQISNVTVDPYGVNLAYGQFARIKYTLSRAANVTISIAPNSGGTPILLTPSPLAQTAGVNEFDWYGQDTTDTSGKKFVVSSDGYYTVTIQAVNPVTGTTSTARASLKMGL